MKNNAIIRGNFIDLLDILEARTWVDVYAESKDGKQKRLDRCQVYQLYKESKYMNYKVVGLYFGIFTNILIREEEE